MMLPARLQIVASEACPAGRSYIVAFRGRSEECKSHTPGRPHLPCWYMGRVDHRPDAEADGFITVHPTVRPT